MKKHHLFTSITFIIIFFSVIMASAENMSIRYNPFQYSAAYTEQGKSLQYLNARYYQPDNLRFVSRDSYTLINRYAYADSNPVMNEDPSGHLAVTPVQGLFDALTLGGSLAGGAGAYKLAKLGYYADAGILGAAAATAGLSAATDLGATKQNSATLEQISEGTQIATTFLSFGSSISMYKGIKMVAGAGEKLALFGMGANGAAFTAAMITTFDSSNKKADIAANYLSVIGFTAGLGAESLASWKYASRIRYRTELDQLMQPLNPDSEVVDNNSYGRDIVGHYQAPSEMLTLKAGLGAEMHVYNSRGELQETFNPNHDALQLVTNSKREFKLSRAAFNELRSQLALDPV